MSYILKQKVLNALESNDLSSIVSLAKENKRVVSLLVRMAYDKETLVGWRAIKAIGMAARELIKTDYDFLRETVRKLLWSLSDESVGIGWSAPEILGEIISSDPDMFDDVVPLIAEVFDIEEKIFRPGILYALAQIARVNPMLVLPHKRLVFRGLADENATVRVNALELLKILKSSFSKDELDQLAKLNEKLGKDPSEVWIYKGESFISVQVKEISRQIFKI
jgi:HEAT repeat protein